MARKTYLDLVNQVARKLRRDPYTSVSNSQYSRLLGELVNTAKREVEDAWAWTELRKVVTVTTDTTNQSYRLENLGDRYRIQDVYNDTLNQRIKAGSNYAHERDLYAAELTAGPPNRWRISGLESGDPTIQFERVPDQVYSIQVVVIDPQDDLTSDATELLVPHWPVVEGGYKLAIAERGEDGGVNFDFAQAQYQSALTDAIGNDNTNNMHGWSSDWTVE